MSISGAYDRDFQHAKAHEEVLLASNLAKDEHLANMATFFTPVRMLPPVYQKKVAILNERYSSIIATYIGWLLLRVEYHGSLPRCKTIQYT